MNVNYVFLVLHLLGLAIGAGGAYTTDIQVLFTMKKGVVSRDAYAFLHRAGLIVFFGLGISLLSGIGLFLQAPEAYLGSLPFLTKMSLVLVILLNGLAIHFFALPTMKRFVGKELLKEEGFARRVPLLTLLSTISSVTWLAVIILGANLGIDLGLWTMVVVYLATIVVAYVGAYAGYLFLRSR